MIKSGIIGLCVADALGVPVEFGSRDNLQANPVTDMEGYGSHDQPPGTWSDDTSLTLCLMDSLANGLDYADIMQKFRSWLYSDEYTPYGKTFGVGCTCLAAITRSMQITEDSTTNRDTDGISPILCGGSKESDNGNGSLMRILPIVFYLHSVYGADFSSCEEAFSIIHNISALTHAHARSKIACGIYISIAGELINNCTGELQLRIYDGIKKAKKYYDSKKEYKDELKHYNRIFNDSFINLPLKEINSSGYVVDTLEAAVWCLLNSDSYKNCVLKAVNLGDDTDTVAAVAGGLAGIFYGFCEIPEEWVCQIPQFEKIVKICEDFDRSLSKIGRK